MPKRKTAIAAKSQPSLTNLPAPEMKDGIKTPPLRPAAARPERPASDPFIVDNSDADWKVARYLYDWCELARAFDIATGYFEIGSLLALDGQWQKLEQIRILMGDEVTKKTKQAFDAALNRVAAVLDDSLEREKENNDFLTGVPAIVDALQSGKIACRVYNERKFHAKAYITYAKMEVISPVALVGSSNFTYPGLHDNIELNIQVRSEVRALQEWYERHWDAAQDVTPDLLKVIEPHVREYSPFEVYAKSLYELFRGHALTASEWERTESRMYPILDQYQREGYQTLLKIGSQYGGALLCDGVGLGKTFIGLMLIERLVEHDRRRVALIVPKAARKPVWESKLKHHLPGLDGVYSNLAIYNHTDLLRGDDYIERMAEIQAKADVVIIDEAHHFRNQASKRYKKLFEMLAGKQLFLLTATPVNNSLLDLQHLIELFSRKQADYFRSAPLGIHSLPGHFRKLESALEKLTGASNADFEISLADADKLLSTDALTQALVVQRSRAYAKKSQQQNGVTQVIFPTRADPQVADYSLQKTYGGLLNKLRQAFFQHGRPPLLSLAIYNAAAYSKRPEGVDDFERGRQAQIVGLIRTQLLKRFESSAVSFRATCERLLFKLLAFVIANSLPGAEQKRLDRWQAQHSDGLAQALGHHQPTADSDDEAEDDVLPPEFLEAAEKLSRAEYNVGDILDETFLDLDQLLVFLNELTAFAPEHDDKLQTLIGLLTTEPGLKDRKVLIFSEYMETAHYVFEQLKKANIGPADEVHSGVERDRGEIITAFAPYYNDSSSGELAQRGKTETRVLVTTDVLAEGLNLQDATLLINYDLHWNPVRLMQRIGRVDRRLDPETEGRLVADHPELAATRGLVRFWNFLPPKELNDLLSLYERVAHKTLRISKVFGIEGQKLLRPEDEYAALRDFNQTYEGTATTIETMLLSYQALLKDYPGLEEQLARFPRRIFSGKAHPIEGATAVFCCYNRPARNAVTGNWDAESGDTQWYLYDLADDKIVEDVEAINAVIYSALKTPRLCVMDQAALREIRLKIEKHITNTYLKPAQAPIGAKVTLRTWMELN